MSIRIKSYISLLFCLILFPLVHSNTILADESSGSAGTFLRMGVGARALAMGKAFVAVSDDPTASYWNPAGLCQIMQIQTEATYVRMPLDRTYYFLGSVFPIKRVGTFGISWINLRINNLEARTFNTLQPDYFFTDSENAILLSFGRRITSHISIGANLKWVNHKLDDYSASGFGFDGAFLFSPVENLKVGLTFQDIGTSQKWNSGHTDFYPLTIRFGSAYQLNSYLSLAAGLDKTSRETTKLHFGAEITALQCIPFQIGYSQNNFAAGAGLEIPLEGMNLKLGYNFSQDNLVDQYTHGISLNLSFSRKPMSLPSSQKLQREKKETRALLETKTHTSKTIVETKVAILNIREGPGIQFERIGKVKKGDRFVVLNESNGWYRMQFGNGKKGWVSSKYVKKTKRLVE